MNIFVLSNNPVEAAQMQCDKHVVKMVLETAQILCSAYEKAPYRRTHYNHPSSKWTRKSKLNYLWLIDHGLALSLEYEFRYGKVHKSKKVILWCKKNINKLVFEKEKRTPFAQAMPDKYRSKNPVTAYRKYYLNDKRSIAKWTKRDPPFWWF